MTGILAQVIGFGERTLQAAATPTSVSGSYNGSSSANQNITTGVAVLSATGGKTPYTYAWSDVGGSGYTWTPTAPTAAASAFTAGAVGSGTVAFTLLRGIVTDANGMTASAFVQAEAHNNSTA